MQDTVSSCANSEPFALQVLGDSMEPEFPDECIVTIEPYEQAKHGMYVMALVEGVRWFRLYLNDDQGERLVALNSMYPEIPLDGLDWKMEGLIIQRTLKRDREKGIGRDVKRYKYNE